MQETTDMRKAYNRMLRRVNKAIYHSKDCWCSFHNLQEYENVCNILIALYNDYLENKEDYYKDYLGMKAGQLQKILGIRIETLKGCIWMIIPQFVNVRGYGANIKKTRRFKLNKYGIEITRVLLHNKIREEEKKNKNV